jgi:hypothetical protein
LGWRFIANPATAKPGIACFVASCRRFARGGVLDFLASLPELLAFNDEARPIHAFKREGEATQVEWQKSLSRIAESKGRRFTG